jgi:RNA polymerase sigma-70 factor (ECF subfamily)
MSPLPDVVDTEELVRRVLAGDTDSFGLIVRRYEADVWKVAAALLGDRTAAENLVQQTFINAYERLEQYRPGRDVLAWLKGIARNLAREDMRKSSRESQTLHRYREYLITLYDDDDRAERRAHELEHAVAHCRERLAPTAARALALYYDQGLSLEAVAAGIERTLDATRQLMFRARAALRDCVQAKVASP